jgi:hypothetical protein
MDNFYSFRKAISFITFLLCLAAGNLQAQTYAGSQVNGVTGLCLICGVSNPNNPVGNSNLNDYSTFNITAGLLGTTVYQTLIFPALSITSCDSLIIGIGSGDALLSVNLFAGITVQTFNGATANNDVQQITASNLSLLQNNTRAEVLLKPANTFDRVKITLSSSLVGLLNGFRLYYAYHKPSTPKPVAIDSTAICAGDSVTLSATGSSGTTIRWYNAANGGSLLFTGNNYKVGPAATTIYYAEANIGGCTSLRKPVKVVVNAIPAAPVYVVPQTIVCGSTSIPVLNHQNGINYQVTIKYTFPASPAKDTSFVVVNKDTITTPPFYFLPSAQADIYVRAVNALTGCRSDSVHMIFNTGGTGGIPNTDADSLTICKYDSVTLHAYNPVSNLYFTRWYDTPAGGNLLFTGNYFKVGPAVTTTYYVTSGYYCEHPVRRPVKVIVNKLPAPVYTVPQAFVCGSTKIFVSNHVAGRNYNVRVKYSLLSSVFFDTSYLVVNKDTITTPDYFSLGSLQADIYVQGIDPLTGCRSDSAHMIFNTGISGGPASVDADSVTICHGDSVTLHAFNIYSSVFIMPWYDAPIGGNLLFTGNYFKVGPDTTTSYYVTSKYICEYRPRRQVKVIVTPCLAKTTLLLTRESNAIGVTTKQLQLFPNPTRGEIYFTTGGKDFYGSVAIIRNLNGREVHREILKKNGLKLSGQLIAGLYFIQITTPQKEVYSGKILLQQ